MIDVKEVEKTEVNDFPRDALPSEYIASQPLASFCAGTVRNSQGQMCGWGHLYNFYGYEWEKYDAFNDSNFLDSSLISHVLSRVRQENTGGRRCQPYWSCLSGSEFDDIFKEKGPAAARDWFVEKLQKIGF